MPRVTLTHEKVEEERRKIKEMQRWRGGGEKQKATHLIS